MGATPVQQSEALQPHVLTSPLSNHPTLLVAPLVVRPMDGPPAVICTDPSPGLKALVDDPLLKKHRITIELGQAKNLNKNPVAERAVQELETELLRQEPLGGAVSPLTLAVATSAFELSYPFTWPILARNVDTARPVFKPAVSTSSVYPTTPTVSAPKPPCTKGVLLL